MSLSSEPSREPGFSPPAPFQNADPAPELEPEATLPIPMGPVRSQLTVSRDETPRPSLWRRITMRRRANESANSPIAEATVARLGAIDLHLEQLNTSVDERLEALNERLSEVWESEEQLSHLVDIQDKLDQLTSSHGKLTQAVVDLRRIIGWTAALVVVAAGSLGFALNQLF